MYAQEGFGEAETAKYVHFFSQTPYCPLAPRFKNRRPWADRRRDHLAKRL